MSEDANKLTVEALRECVAQLKNAAVRPFDVAEFRIDLTYKVFKEVMADEYDADFLTECERYGIPDNAVVRLSVQGPSLLAKNGCLVLFR